MFFDDDEPVTQTTTPQPANVELMSVEELQDYQTWLDAEKSRAQSEIDRKQSAVSAADSFFK